MMSASAGGGREGKEGDGGRRMGAEQRQRAIVRRSDRIGAERWGSQASRAESTRHRQADVSATPHRASHSAVSQAGLQHCCCACCVCFLTGLGRRRWSLHFCLEWQDGAAARRLRLHVEHGGMIDLQRERERTQTDRHSSSSSNTDRDRRARVSGRSRLVPCVSGGAPGDSHSSPPPALSSAVLHRPAWRRAIRFDRSDRDQWK